MDLPNITYINIKSAETLATANTYTDNRTMKTRIARTLTEAVNAITFTVGDDGLPLSGKRGILRLVAPSGCTAPTGTSATMSITINDITSGYCTDSSDNGSSIIIGAIRNQSGVIDANLNILLDKCVTITSSGLYSDGTTRTMIMRAGALISNISNITKISAALSGSYTMPIGTKIEYLEGVV